MTGEQQSYIDLEREAEMIRRWGQDLVQKRAAELMAEDSQTGFHRTALLAICAVREARAAARSSQALNALYGNVSAEMQGLTPQELGKIYMEPANHTEHANPAIVNSRSRY